MAKPPAHPRRRRFIKLTATGLVIAPFASALLSDNAVAVDVVKESDPAAVKLKYKADATKARERKDPAAFCDNCALYTGKADSANGPCAALDGKFVDYPIVYRAQRTLDLLREHDLAGSGRRCPVDELEVGEVDVVLPHLLQAAGDHPVAVDGLDPRGIVELRDGRERPRRRRPLGVVPGEDQPVDLEHVD